MFSLLNAFVYFSVSSLLLLSRVLQIWERFFYSQVFFLPSWNLVQSAFMKTPLGLAVQFNLEGCRAFHWGPRHRSCLFPYVCLNHTVFGKSYYLVGSSYMLGAATNYHINYFSLFWILYISIFLDVFIIR